eukprot:CAMPEP_0201546912 /NCGR_PEP_ID=MMETSP0173_2-20130828/3291_1 /ASSEMBLY_ACC=CAM_ASM_000268 /TAXON_ID=218659 /ORGANISM="Vexillifera sp., Strain DIVA3 564/2" /LENGTH=769 /DNA_ID=CAMNT_0047955745 /DNA_START=31 /DNA_END=2337 /DNA_ORIENTATION=+
MSKPKNDQIDLSFESLMFGEESFDRDSSESDEQSPRTNQRGVDSSTISQNATNATNEASYYSQLSTSSEFSSGIALSPASSKVASKKTTTTKVGRRKQRARGNSPSNTLSVVKSTHSSSSFSSRSPKSSLPLSRSVGSSVASTSPLYRESVAMAAASLNGDCSLNIVEYREKERDKNAVFVFSDDAKVVTNGFHMSALIREIEKEAGESIKIYHYRDKQYFCFVQLHSEAVANRVAKQLSGKFFPMDVVQTPSPCGVKASTSASSLSSSNSPANSSSDLEKKDDTSAIASASSPSVVVTSIATGVSKQKTDTHPIKVQFQRCTKVTPGRDPRKSNDPKVHNSILVIKNLPFSLKQEELTAVLAAYPSVPESVSFHYDSSGMFRGMAFIKYASVQDAVNIFDVINGMDVGGRPIRVEYKRNREKRRNNSSSPSSPSSSSSSKASPNTKRRSPDFAMDEEGKKLFDQLNHFKESSSLNDLAFPPTLSSQQKKQIHIIAEKLSLNHYSQGEGEHRYLIVSKPRHTLPSTDTIQINPNRRSRRDRSRSENGSSPQQTHYQGRGQHHHPPQHYYKKQAPFGDARRNRSRSYNPKQQQHGSWQNSRAEPYLGLPGDQQQSPQYFSSTSPRSIRGVSQYGHGSWRSSPGARGSRSASSLSGSSPQGNVELHSKSKRGGQKHYGGHPPYTTPTGDTPTRYRRASIAGSLYPTNEPYQSQLYATPPSHSSRRRRSSSQFTKKNQSQKPSDASHVPIRQPFGPSATKGFSEDYQKRRMN